MAVGDSHVGPRERFARRGRRTLVRMSGSLRRGWITRAGTAALILLYGLPFLWLIATSLKTETEIFGNEAGLLFQPTFDTYRAILNTDLLQACANSAII